MCRFYLGIHHPSWIRETAVPLFVSYRVLRGLKRLYPAAGPWALDSGGFTELNMHGKWTVAPKDYVAGVRRIMAGVGNMEWAAIQDWMCEEGVRCKTGLSVAEHQRLTAENYALLLEIAPEVPWAPVLQGQTVSDYVAHLYLYQDMGLDLSLAPVVGVGSVCRRQATREAEEIFSCLASSGLRLHGFGVKTARSGAWEHLHSADSMAWSMAARRNPGLRGSPECAHKTCANCLPFALKWRASVIERMGS